MAFHAEASLVSPLGCLDLGFSLFRFLYFDQDSSREYVNNFLHYTDWIELERHKIRICSHRAIILLILIFASIQHQGKRDLDAEIHTITGEFWKHDSDHPTPVFFCISHRHASEFPWVTVVFVSRVGDYRVVDRIDTPIDASTSGLHLYNLIIWCRLTHRGFRPLYNPIRVSFEKKLGCDDKRNYDQRRYATSQVSTYLLSLEYHTQ